MSIERVHPSISRVGQGPNGNPIGGVDYRAPDASWCPMIAVMPLAIRLNDSLQPEDILPGPPDQFFPIDHRLRFVDFL